MRAIGRGRIAVGVATALLIVLPLAGAAGGVYVVVPSNPPAGACGLWGLLVLMLAGFGLVVGFVAGVGTAWLMARGLFRWANGCGLAEVGDDSDIL